MTELCQLDILVSNAAHQTSKENIEDFSDEEWDRTFTTNVYAYFWLVKAALPHMSARSAIIVTGSETGFLGPGHLADYSATKGAIHTMTKSFAKQLAQRGIRVNCVAPRPVWTPLNPSDPGASPEKVLEFGKKTPLANRPFGAQQRVIAMFATDVSPNGPHYAPCESDTRSYEGGHR